MLTAALFKVVIFIEKRKHIFSFVFHLKVVERRKYTQRKAVSKFTSERDENLRFCLALA